MQPSLAESTLRNLQDAMDKPIILNDLKVTFISASRVSHPVRWICPKHTHDFYEHFLVLDGGIYTTFNNKEITVNEGKYFLVPPFVEHSHRYMIPNKADEGYCFRWKMEKIRSSRPDVTPMADEIIGVLSGIYTVAIDNEEFNSILYDGKKYKSLSEAQFALLNWLIGLYTVFKKYKASPETKRMSSQDKRWVVNSVTLMIDTMYAKKIDVNELARKHNISYSRLSRIFKEVAGKTIVEYLMTARIQHAKILLTGSELPIKQIAYLSGFNDQYYFSKAFKNMEGITPSKARQQKGTRSVTDGGSGLMKREIT